MTIKIRCVKGWEMFGGVGQVDEADEFRTLPALPVPLRQLPHPLVVRILPVKEGWGQGSARRGVQHILKVYHDFSASFICWGQTVTAWVLVSDHFMNNTNYWTGDFQTRGHVPIKCIRVVFISVIMMPGHKLITIHSSSLRGKEARYPCVAHYITGFKPETFLNTCLWFHSDHKSHAIFWSVSTSHLIITTTSAKSTVNRRSAFINLAGNLTYSMCAMWTKAFIFADL